MRLAAIYNVWDGVELLEASMRSVAPHVDIFIIVYQTTSNFGEFFDPSQHWNISPYLHRLIYYTPSIISGAVNETEKRNLGLNEALALGCTHFLHMDCDEIYSDFGEAKAEFIASGADGSVCRLFTYFKSPKWRFETEDGYFVPFIHRLHPHTLAGNFSRYPFHCDPTRKINTENVVKLEHHMQHYSWVRLDIGRKARNSSARHNISKGTMLASYNDPACGPGYYVKDYDKKLIEVPDYFNLLPIFES